MQADGEKTGAPYRPKKKLLMRNETGKQIVIARNIRILEIFEYKF